MERRCSNDEGGLEEKGVEGGKRTDGSNSGGNGNTEHSDGREREREKDWLVTVGLRIRS